VGRQEEKKEVEDGDHGKPYLQQRVEYSEGRLMDEESKGVMMAWEKPLMEAHAKCVCGAGGDILNVGFGMGLVDTAIQGYSSITSHTIIEAHPDVYKRMLETGWGEKPNVHIVFGRWQDVLPQLGKYDGTMSFTLSLLLENCIHVFSLHCLKKVFLLCFCFTAQECIPASVPVGNHHVSIDFSFLVAVEVLGECSSAMGGQKLLITYSYRIESISSVCQDYSGLDQHVHANGNIVSPQSA
jgi:hypothetical protein